MKPRLILPAVGLFLFAFGTYGSVRFNREIPPNLHRYFWWSSIRLDSDPLNTQTESSYSCDASPKEAPCWESVSIWVDSGEFAKIFIICAFPAFLTGKVVVRGLGRIGISEVKTFMFAMPPLIFAWYYFVAWAFSQVATYWRARYSTQAER